MLCIYNLIILKYPGSYMYLNQQEGQEDPICSPENKGNDRIKDKFLVNCSKPGHYSTVNS